MNNLLQIIILTLSAAFFLIGLHQTMTLGFMHSYWIFMLSISLILLYKLKKEKK
ncbi:hypothetical protein SAMN04488029_2251 [Reichenbachiella faecimaris]|uniref:Uncharacterized protein n=1 Tax=Reichenbachiella faecimaris TaxID=692418 RepID=A0A1W2GEZ4_REIFA|nr:hypothetical protein SAMN04488029_2251 [Reichenbachiella faecimaris]